MNKKLSIPFEFSMPRTQKVVRNLKIVTVHVGDLHISGTGYLHPQYSTLEPERYSADIDSIKWGLGEVLDLLETTELFSEIEEAACQHVCGLFEQREVAA